MVVVVMLLLFGTTPRERGSGDVPSKALFVFLFGSIRTKALVRRSYRIHEASRTRHPRSPYCNRKCPGRVTSFPVFDNPALLFLSFFGRVTGYAYFKDIARGRLSGGDTGGFLKLVARADGPTRHVVVGVQIMGECVVANRGAIPCKRTHGLAFTDYHCCAGTHGSALADLRRS